LKSTIGGWNAAYEGLGGWALSVHHAYDPVRKTLYLGTGQRRAANESTVANVITTFAGGGGSSSDGVPASQFALNVPFGVLAYPDGTVRLFDDNGFHLVDTQGIIHNDPTDTQI